jgi:hypothetical protein
MGIGPEAREMASGRIVVVAGLLGAIGAAAVVLGAGPVLLAAEPAARGTGYLAIATGGVMLVATLSLALRRGPVRALGTAGGLAAAVLGATIAVAAAGSLDACSTPLTRPVECSAVVGAAALVGLGILAVGVGSVVVVRRARPESLRRRRPPARHR